MKRMTCFVMALALVLGLAQCKKEQPATPQNEGNSVMITLNVGGDNSGTRANVDPYPTSGDQVTFENGDVILVASGGKYVGMLTRTEGVFSGSITDPVENQKLYFYFLGNNAVLDEPIDGEIKGCTVNISDQSNYPHLPVISMGKSNETYPSEGNFYSSRLYNKCSLMKFNVTTDSNAAICITGMNNMVTVEFGKYDETGTGLGEDDTNNGFSYSMDETDGGLIKMAGGAGSPAVKWAIVLPQPALTETGDAYSEDQSYIGTRPAIHAIESNKYYHEGADVISMTVNTHVWNGNLAELTGNEPEGFATARNGMTVYGTLAVNAKVSIADGATVALRDATITYSQPYNSYAGITCPGNATLVLEGSNTVGTAGVEWPCIYIAEGKTLTIRGEGSLDVSNQCMGAGIGGGWNNHPCGNIVIEGGNITATANNTLSSGAGSGAAIGAGNNNSRCGDITITGGTITATSSMSAGIGAGISNSRCGNITITGGTITANGGYASARIGTSSNSPCGDITISGGTIIANIIANEGNDATTGIGAGEGMTCDNITITGGNISATGRYVGIGASSSNSKCGNISISNATVTARGTHIYYGCGIGIGLIGSVGTITIYDNVVSVTAIKGSSDCCHCIGKGSTETTSAAATFGTITIGDTVYPDGEGVTHNQADGVTYIYPEPTPAEQIVDLSTITSAYTAIDGDILTGTLGVGMQISITDGATITLRSANINGAGNLSGAFHGLQCLGDATIILENNDNYVKASKGSSDGKAGIFVPRYKTLTIQSGNSSGRIVADGAGEAAGIGGCSGQHCGAIVINSGKVTATAGDGIDEFMYEGGSAGIGSSAGKRCGGITIHTGQIIATGAAGAAGIGTGASGICRQESDSEGTMPAITINISDSGDGWVKAYKGEGATYFIGGGTSSKCGIVTVGNTTYVDGNDLRGISSETSLSGDYTVSGNSLVYMP